MKQVAIIIINYNSSAYTINCLQSIKKQTAASLLYEIIVVDNNSAAADYDKVRAFCDAEPAVQLVRSIVNLGFSGGNMLGLQFARAEYLYFLNNDCELLNDNLRILYDFMRARPAVAVCTGQMYDRDQQHHHSFNHLPALALELFGVSILRKLSPQKYPRKKYQYHQPTRVQSVTGAAMFVDARKFAQIGGFDTSYFLYCEEEDVCYTFKKHGYEAYLVPAARYIHYAGQSTDPNFNLAREFYISLLYLHRKHQPLPAYLVLKFLYMLKNLKHAFRRRSYLKLAYYILRGAPMKYSLRHKQTLNIK